MLFVVKTNGYTIIDVKYLNEDISNVNAGVKYLNIDVNYHKFDVKSLNIDVKYHYST